MTGKQRAKTEQHKATAGIVAGLLLFLRSKLLGLRGLWAKEKTATVKVSYFIRRKKSNITDRLDN